MIYNKYGDVPRDTDVWACAYSPTYSEKNMCYKKEPVLGKIINNHFFEYKKDGVTIKTSSKVSIYAREYTDTLEECVDLYNSLIDKHVKRLEDLIANHVSNKISLIGRERHDS